MTFLDAVTLILLFMLFCICLCSLSPVKAPIFFHLPHQITGILLILFQGGSISKLTIGHKLRFLAGFSQNMLFPKSWIFPKNSLTWIREIEVIVIL